MLKRRRTGSLCYGEGRRQKLLQKTCSFRALGELQLAFYLYQHEQIDYCRPELVKGHGYNTDVSLVKKQRSNN